MKRLSLSVPLLAILIAASLVMGALLVGCGGQPLELEPVPDEALTPLFKVTVDEDTYEYDLGNELPYEDCAGEDMQTHGKILVHVREMTTPSGNLIVSGWVDYTFEQITVEGLSTGEIWTLTNGFNPFHEVIKEDGSYFLHYQWHEFYTNEDGEKLRAFVNGNYQIDQDGNVRIERESVRCF
jgi:hypothetical protein